MDQRNTSNETDHETMVIVDRDEKQAKGVCVRKRCERAAEDGSDYCKVHGERQRASNARYMARKRAEWAREGRCTNCGAEKRKRGSKWCVECVIRDERVKISSVDRQVENHHERVTKRIQGWKDSPTNVGRVRLRGGKRGAPKADVADRNDLGDIKRTLERYSIALDEAYGPEVAALTPMQRESSRRAAYAWLGLAIRSGMETFRRHRLEIPVLEADHPGLGDIARTDGKRRG